MTENTPDAVKVAATVEHHDAIELAHRNWRDDQPGIIWSSENREHYIVAASAILGARAMQDAMAGQEVRLEKRPTAFLIEGRDWGVEVVLEEERAQTVCERVLGTEYYGLYRRDGLREPAGAQEGSHQVAHAGDMMGDTTPSHTSAAGAQEGAKDVRTEHTPAGAGDLVERLRETSPRYDELTGKHMYDVFENRDGEKAASRIEALEAEVRSVRISLDGWTHAAEIAEHRATTAEADLAALRAEVERKDKALREAREDILGFTRARGSEYEGTDEDAVGFIDAALSPAKAGG